MMNIICLGSSEENKTIENEAGNFDDNYNCQKIFYPLLFLEVEVCMHYFSRVRRTGMKVVVDGLSGVVSFVCNEIETYEVQAKSMEILPLTVKTDVEGLGKVKDSLLPLVFSKIRKICVRPSINILKHSIIYKQLYRLSSKDGDGEIIFLDKINGQTAILKAGVK